MAAWRLMDGGFPLRFDGNLAEQQVERGLTRINVKVVPADKLEDFIAKLDIFRSSGKDYRDYLKKRGLEQKIDRALEWADSVKQIMNPASNPTIKVEYPENPNPDYLPLADRVTVGELSGALSISRDLSLNTVRPREVSKTPGAQDDWFKFRFYNDAQGREETEAILEINQGLTGLIAYLLEGSRVSNNGTYYISTKVLQLNTGEKAQADFHLVLPNAIVQPPDWDFLEN